MSSYRLFLSSLLVLSLSACSEHALLPVEAGYGPDPALPQPNKTLIPTVNVATAVGWPENGRPSPAAGLVVHAFARGLDHPRWLYVLPNGDVLVAETNAPPKPGKKKSIKSWFTDKAMERAGAGVPSANRISLLRDSDRDGVADVQTPFLENLNSPFGIALVGDQLYVANTDAVVRFPYRAGQTRINVQGEKVMDLPGGPINHHWTKNLIASPDGRKLYVTSGSNSNVGENGMENEEGRAAIWEYDLASGQSRIFASGLRNPNGLDWEPHTGALWTAVNERDEIGSDLVPDYVTSVQEGGFYGWPYSYYGQHVDARVTPPRPDLVAKALVPDYALGAHTASLGISFAERSALPRFNEGLFVAQHGSWNRKPHSGYKVIFIPFANGKPNGQPIDVLTGFLNEKQEAMGRPVDVALDSQGALLVTDDVGNTVWRVSPQTGGAAASP
ncbi:PQQ-dependent sugar dehydrogenase [Serpens gallinarum]|uniref:Sorbosone dehydrogenase family protein n=1 Tax=Serpens gallinarum TaxID=2763075 RepID=A0ABR8TNU8_9PSED|nr:sorbosone dehydrogenase family protein [Serpens gallinarum]MBD7977439.1 sorbosone dehydrogenase family protein [Serpens gallinarum]